MSQISLQQCNVILSTCIILSNVRCTFIHERTKQLEFKRNTRIFLDLQSILIYTRSYDRSQQLMIGHWLCSYLIVNVKVVYLVTWPLSGSEAGVGRQTSLVSLFFHMKIMLFLC